MAFPAKDGSMHHSAGRASLHDSMSSGAEKKQNVGPMKKPAAKHDGSGETKSQLPANHPHMAGPHQQASDTSIGEHVAEHGPATHVMHAEQDGTHHVTTHHGGLGQNMHHSSHESHEAAHSHMGEAMGADLTEESPDETDGSVDDNSDEGAMVGSKISKIPGLK